MLRKIKSSILYKTLCYFLIVSIPLTLIYGLFSYNKFNDIMEDQLKSNVSNSLTTFQSDINDIVKKIDNFGNYLTFNTFMVNSLYQSYDTTIAMTKNINDFTSEYKNVHQLLIGSKIDSYILSFYVNNELPMSESLPDGKNAVLHIEDHGVRNTTGLDEFDWYHKTLEKDGELYVFTPEKNNGFIYYTKTIKSQPEITPGFNNSFLGINLVGIQAYRMTNLLEQTKKTPNMTFAILDKNNNIIHKSIHAPDEAYIKNILKNTYLPPETFSFEDNSYVTTVVKLTGDIRIAAFLPRFDIYASTKDIRTLFLTVLAIIFLLSIAASLLFSFNLTKPIKKLSSVMSKCEPERVAALNLKIPSNDEVGELYLSFNRLIDTINQLINNINTKNEETKKLELKMFQFQINPHFLYNTLDSIAWRAMMKNQDDLIEMIENLAYIFRYSVKSINEFASIKEELEMVEKYVELQRYRCDSSISFETLAAPECDEIKIPKCLLQPLVENAVIHWYNPDDDTIRIKISIQSCDTFDEIFVEDNGTLCDCEYLNSCIEGKTEWKKNSIGLKNISARIELSFGDKSRLYFKKSEAGGTVAVIHINK